MMELEGGCRWDMKGTHRWDEPGLGLHAGHRFSALTPPSEGYLLIQAYNHRII